MQNPQNRSGGTAAKYGLLFSVIIIVTYIMLLVLGHYSSFGIAILYAIYLASGFIAGMFASRQTGQSNTGRLAGFLTGLFASLVIIIIVVIVKASGIQVIGFLIANVLAIICAWIGGAIGGAIGKSLATSGTRRQIRPYTIQDTLKLDARNFDQRMRAEEGLSAPNTGGFIQIHYGPEAGMREVWLHGTRDSIQNSSARANARQDELERRHGYRRD